MQVLTTCQDKLTEVTEVDNLVTIKLSKIFKLSINHILIYLKIVQQHSTILHIVPCSSDDCTDAVPEQTKVVDDMFENNHL